MVISIKEGLPHSDIHGSKPARGSPWLFAACHVLHRLLVPRHPPNALIALKTRMTHPLRDQPRPPCTETIHKSRQPPIHRRTASHKHEQNHTHISLRAHVRHHRGRELRDSQKATPPLVRLADRDTHTSAPEPIQLPKTNTLGRAHAQRRDLFIPPDDDIFGSLYRKPPKPQGQKTLVEVDGIEPTTPCLQSRCSPS